MKDFITPNMRKALEEAYKAFEREIVSQAIKSEEARFYRNMEEHNNCKECGLNIKRKDYIVNGKHHCPNKPIKIECYPSVMTNWMD